MVALRSPGTKKEASGLFFSSRSKSHGRGEKAGGGISFLEPRSHTSNYTDVRKEALRALVETPQWDDSDERNFNNYCEVLFDVHLPT